MRQRKGLGPIDSTVTAVVAILAALILIVVLAPAIQDVSPTAFLPENLIGGLAKDATPS
jgi:hypothetical protein